MTLNFDDAAVLLWLPKGEEPATKHFKAEADLGPPAPNPEGHWDFGSALLRSKEATGEHGKLPWIKVGAVVLNPERVGQACDAFRDGREFEA